MPKSSKEIEIIIPMYNESLCLDRLFQELNQILCQSIDYRWRCIFVDDGSNDDTFQRCIYLSKMYLLDVSTCVISFSRNFGKEAAMLAALNHSRGDACIFIDSDLQDPPDLIPLMLQKWLDGYQIVNARRKDRKSDTIIKRITSSLFYKLFNHLTSLQSAFNVSDFRLIDKSVVQSICQCRESVRFSKGFFAWVGFNSCDIEYTRPKRTSGTTKWNLWRLWNYALDGIFSFSINPLRIWSYVGASITFISFLVGLRVLLKSLIYGIEVPGYASLFVAFTFLGGVQLIGIGILAEYIGRIYIETKKRPQYIVKEMHSHDLP